MTEAVAHVTGRMARIPTRKEASFGTGLRKRILLAIILIAMAALCSGFSGSSGTERSEQSIQSTDITDSHVGVAVVTQEGEESRPPRIVRIETEKGPYVVLNGDSLTINGSGSVVLMSGSSIGTDNIQPQAAPIPDTVKLTGQRIRFTQDGKAYTISDPATVEYAKSLFRPIEELGRKQGEIGSQQGQLRAEQGELGQRQSEYTGDSDEEHAAEQMQLAKRRLALAEKQIIASEEQIAMAKQQIRLAEKQAQLAQEQTKAAKHAIEEMKQIIMNSLQNGLATPD
jgi:hypothetical protein